MRQRQQSSSGRLKSILDGAFAGPPTPLKDIPKKSGESRQIGRKKRARVSRKSNKIEQKNSA